MDADRARSLLTAALSELDERARFAESTRAETGVPIDVEGSNGQHPGDAASDVAVSMDAELLADTVADQRRTVQDALARLDGGSYGRCAVCDRQIDDERLQVRPEVRTCREHADAPIVS